MKLFSYRKGIKTPKVDMQIDYMDQDLKNGLWNALTIFYWDQVKTHGYSYMQYHKKISILVQRLWIEYFKQPVDTLDSRWNIVYKEIRTYFFQCNWNEVYDFIEFIANNYKTDSYDKKNEDFTKFCNKVLKTELSAYRFVDYKIIQITSEEEISEIEEALDIPAPFKTVKIHLETALKLLSNKKSPDYRNSIKESISAVEAICKLISSRKKITLGNALKIIEDKISIHPALKKAFSSLYGYTSDADGIRHALMEEEKLSFEDAKFMLVSVSCFINYLIAKLPKEIKL